MATLDPRKKRRPFLLRPQVLFAVAVVSAAGIWAYLSWRYPVIGTAVERHETGVFERGEILLRTTAPECDVLLIGPISSSDQMDIRRGADPMPTRRVYRFDPTVGRLELFGVGAWSDATGSITMRGGVPFDTAPIKLDIKSHALSINGSRISTAGPYAVDIDVSPDRQFVNVISATQEQTTGSFLWVFGGGGYPRGPYYHEVFERLTGKKVGDTYTLNTWRGVALSYCWEAQGKYVVYHDRKGKYLWIVPGPQQSLALKD